MRNELTALGILLFSACAMAQNTDAPQECCEPITTKAPYLDLKAEARADWQMTQYDGVTDKSNSGFEGKFMSIYLNGTITKGLSYSWRQRFNKYSLDRNFFDATDWLYVDYRYKDWSVRAGKDVVAIGGWEYDANPINIYTASAFWNNIGCYQWGVSGAFHAGANDIITAQISQSPFFTSSNRNMYAYNLMWNGKHGIFTAIYSLNYLEYTDGKYISYIALGNKFDVDNVTLELDLMNRASSHQTFLFKDASIMAELTWHIKDRWNIKGKYTYDVNKSGTNADKTVLNGTELNMAGAVVEFYPLLKKRTSLRLHAGCWYGWGNNTNTADVMQNKTLFVSAGVTWNMDIFRVNRK